MLRRAEPNSSRASAGPFHYPLITSELLITAEIVEAPEDEPYLSLVFRLDPEIVSSVMIEPGDVLDRDNGGSMALAVSSLGEGLLDASFRLVRLVESPDEVGVVAPLVIREIVFRLLGGAQAVRRRHVAVFGGDSSWITSAVRRLHKTYDKPLTVEELRLREARRLLVTDDLDLQLQDTGSATTVHPTSAGATSGCSAPRR